MLIFGQIAASQEVKRDIKGVSLGMTAEAAKIAAGKFLTCIPNQTLLVYCKNQYDVNEHIEMLASQQEPHKIMIIGYNFCADGNFDAVFRDLMNDFHGMSEDDAPNKTSKIFVVDDKISAEVKLSGICVTGRTTPRATPTYSITLKDQALIDEAAEFMKKPTEGRVAPKM